MSCKDNAEVVTSLIKEKENQSMQSRVNIKGNLIRTSGKAVGERRLLERGLKPDFSTRCILSSSSIFLT